jgi:cobalt-precorrin-5B (C1)-methyltransferase
LKYLRNLGMDVAVYDSIAQTIETRTEAYIYTHSEANVEIGVILFDRSRQILVQTKKAEKLLESVQEL